METIFAFFDGIWEFMGTSINIYGITMSFRDIYLWSILVCICASFVGGLIRNA